MPTLSLQDFESHCDDFDALILKTPGIDRFCSSTTWVLPAHHAFSSEWDTWIEHYESGYVALTESWHESLGRFRQPMEASWCLASPFATAQPRALMRDFARSCRQQVDQWNLLFLAGLVRHSPLYDALIESFGGDFFVGVGPPMARYQSDLAGGLDAWMGRRSSKFRANARRVQRGAQEAGISTLYLRDFGPQGQDWQRTYERILAVEARSWKGLEGTGIMDGPMCEFYRSMLPRLARRGALRVLFLQRDGEDVAFVFGGIMDRLYRGLQLSYDASFRELSLGNAAQLAILTHLCEEGIQTYDLGSELEYKSKWAETRFETVSVVVRPW